MMGPFDATFVAITVGLAVPILFAATGELASQRSGVINIGLEGMMLGGAFFGFWAAYETQNLLVGTVAGLLAGAALGAIMAALSVSLGADQIVVGIGINILAGGVTAFGYEQVFANAVNAPTVEPMASLAIPGLIHIPVVGEALFDQPPLAYLAYAMIVALWFTLYRTNLGLALRGAGEYPDAVETSGISVQRVRWVAVVFAGAMAGLGGVMLSLGDLGSFNEGMSSGRGFIAIAAVIFGRWRPLGVVGACLVFGAADALQLRLQTATAIPGQVWVALLLIPILVYAYRFARRRKPSANREALALGAATCVAFGVLAIVQPSWQVPQSIWLMLPYVITLVALAGTAGRARLPGALGRPYRRAQSAAEA
jgi:general nucleoside transport system permease protein